MTHTYNFGIFNKPESGTYRCLEIDECTLIVAQTDMNNSRRIRKCQIRKEVNGRYTCINIFPFNVKEFKKIVDRPGSKIVYAHEITNHTLSSLCSHYSDMYVTTPYDTYTKPTDDVDYQMRGLLMNWSRPLILQLLDDSLIPYFFYDESPVYECMFCIRDIVVNRQRCRMSDDCEHYLCLPCFKQWCAVETGCPSCGPPPK